MGEQRQQKEAHYWSCAFWADQLSAGSKSDRNKKDGVTISMNKTTDEQNDQRKSLAVIADKVLIDCLDQMNVPVGCLVAEFLFRNDGRRFDAKMASKCQITMTGYLNSLKYTNGNSLALCQFLSQILPQFECSIPLHSFGVLLKILKADLHQPNVVQLINSSHLVHLWHHCLYQERSSNELNKSIAKNLIAILKTVGPPPVELFKQFLFLVPYFVRHKYLLMRYLLSSCPVEQLDETLLLQFFDQLSLCLEGRWCEAELADAFHALALRFAEMDKQELLAQSIAKTLTMNEAIRENAVRLWFPKLSTSQQLRQTFLRLNSIFHDSTALQYANTVHQHDGQKCREDNAASCGVDAVPYWYYDSIADPSAQWSPQQINLWAFLQIFYWTIKTKIAITSSADLLEEDLGIILSALIVCDKYAIKQIALDLLALLLVPKRPEWHQSTKFTPLLYRLISNFDHFMRLENTTFCDSVNSLIISLSKVYDQEVGQLIKCQLQETVLKCLANMGSTNECPLFVANVARLIEHLDEFKLDVQDFLLKALVYENDSTVRQRSAQMAFRRAKNCAAFKQKLIILFNKMAPQLSYGIVHLYRLLLCLQIDQHELDLHFLENDDGLNIFFLRTKLEHNDPTPKNQNAIAQFLSNCVEVNEKLLQFGGSDCAAQCATVSELHLLFEKCSADEEGENGDDELLFWSDTQKRQLSKYANGIIQSCSAIRWVLTTDKNVAQIDEQSIRKGLRSIWTVLLRSHHKGVLEHCGSDFCAIVEHLGACLSTFPHIREEIIEKTFAILSEQGGGQCRNIAFAKIFLPIFASIDAAQRALLTRQLILIGSQQKVVPFCIKLHLHQLFLLKELLSTTKFDLVDPRPEIFRFIMQMTQIAMDRGQTERWRLFSMAAIAFAAFLHSIFRHFPDIVPLHNFYTVERNFCDNLLVCLRNVCLDLAQKRRSEPSIALLLVPLQRLCVYANPIGHCCAADGFIDELLFELQQLIMLEPSFLLKRQIALVIANFQGQLPP